VQGIEDRLKAIEKSNRRWKWSAILLGVAFMAMTNIAADKPDDATPDIIYARKFVAVNERGEPVAFMGHSNNVGMISIADAKGTLLFAASATDTGHGVVSTFDAEGRRLVAVGANQHGVGHVAVFDRQGKDITHRLETPPVSSGGQ